MAVLDRLDADVDELIEMSFEALTTPERMRVLERVERVARRLPVVQHALINQITEQSSEEELGGKLPAALANRLRITRAEASRRVAEAAELGQRRALTGQPLAPQLSATAAAQRDGDTEWIPPPHLDHGQPRTNTFHHVEKLLRDGDDDEEDAA